MSLATTRWEPESADIRANQEAHRQMSGFGNGAESELAELRGNGEVQLTVSESGEDFGPPGSSFAPGGGERLRGSETG